LDGGRHLVFPRFNVLAGGPGSLALTFSALIPWPEGFHEVNVNRGRLDGGPHAQPLATRPRRYRAGGEAAGPRRRGRGGRHPTPRPLARYRRGARARPPPGAPNRPPPRPRPGPPPPPPPPPPPAAPPSPPPPP